MKRRQPSLSRGSKLEIIPLGAGNEVGRSCIVLRYMGKTVMFDCGIHPAKNGADALPFFDEVDPESVDLLLISHFHLDHAAALPYYLEKTNFKGQVYMTEPTKHIYKLLLSDYVKVSNISEDEKLFDENHLERSTERIQTIDYHQDLEHNGIKFRCYNAGHVLGAAMFMVEIAGVFVLYTGDFSRQEDRHLMGAETPDVRPHILIVESTYGTQNHDSRAERERRFTDFVDKIVRGGGRCLIPVFALGRAQELLLILEEYWEAHAELQHVPIYYASALAKKCMAAYETFMNMMNDKIKRQHNVRNPFKFKHIRNLQNADSFEDHGPSVVMASPGMLQNGLSRELFERWCSDSRNGVILPGYSVEGTLAKQIMLHPAKITTSAGVDVDFRMKCEEVSFSAHSDCRQTTEFISELQPNTTILVHGDSKQMAALRDHLQKQFKGMEVLTPKNTVPVSIVYHGDKVAKTIGSLASDGPQAGKRVSGFVVQKSFNYEVMAPQDLNSHTKLVTSSIHQRQRVPYKQKFSLLEECLKQMFDGVTRADGELAKLRVTCGSFESIEIVHTATDSVTVEWSSTPLTDMLADSVVAIVLQVEASPGVNAIMKRIKDEPTDKATLLVDILKQHFVDVSVDGTVVTVSLDGTSGSYDWTTKTVNSDDAELRQRLERIAGDLDAILEPIKPLP